MAKNVEQKKSIYQVYRENAGLSREAASEKMEMEHNCFVSSDRLFKVEKNVAAITPEDVLAMSKCYKAPELCNHYCSTECPIGQKQIPSLKMKELSQITLETINSLNNLEKQKNRLIEISVDGKITEDEYADFKEIQKNLQEISMAVNTLQLWLQKTIAEGEADPSLLE